MSLICDNNINATSSSTSCQNDVAIDFFKRLFGDKFIGSFYGEGIPATAANTLQNGDINTLALTLNTVALASIFVTCLLLTFSFLYFIIDGANDGAAIGFGSKKESSLLGLIGRPFISMLMLLPTLSGYSVVHILIIYIALIGNNGANKIFQKINDLSIPTANLFKTQTALSDDLKAINDVSEPVIQGAFAAYCMRQTNDDFTGARTQTNSTAGLTLDSGLKPTTFGGVFSQNSFTWVDGTGWLNVTGMNGDICGKFTVNWQNDTAKYDASDLSGTFTLGGHSMGVGSNSTFAANVRDIAEGLGKLNKSINQTRAIAALNAYAQGFMLVNGGCLPSDVAYRLETMAGYEGRRSVQGRSAVLDTWQTCSISESGANAWPVTKSSAQPTTETTGNNTAGGTNTPGGTGTTNGGTTNGSAQNQYNVSAIMKIIKNQNDRVDSQILAILNSQDQATKNKIEEASKSVRREVQSQGWLFSGIGQSRLRQLRAIVRSNIYNKPYEFEPRNITNMDVFQDSEDKKKSPQQEWLTKIDNFERAIYNRLTDLGFTSASPVMTLKAGTSGGSANIDVDGIVTASLKDAVLGVEKKAIQTMLGTESDGTALERIQTTGELFSINAMYVNKSLKLINKTLGGVVVLTAPLQQMPIVSAGHRIAEFAHQNFEQGILPQAIEISNALSDIGRMFGVIIPLMPFAFLAMAAIGWFIQIIQTMFGMLLFFIMHSIPQSSFIGTQQQGYLTLLTLLFRPMLIVSGFFVGFAFFEIAVDFLAYTFFAVHATIQGQTLAGGIGFLELVTLVSTMKWWWYGFAALLISAAYGCFGLTQELADGMFDWLGTSLLRGFGNMKTDTIMQSANATAKNNASEARRAAGSLNKPNNGNGPNASNNGGQGNDPNGGNGGNGGLNSLASDDNGTSAANQPASRGVSPAALTLTSTGSSNSTRVASKANLSTDLPIGMSRDAMLSSTDADGNSMFVQSKQSPKSDMLAKAHATLDGKKHELQLQGGLLGAGVAAVGGLVGARHGISNRLDALKAMGNNSIGSKLSAVTSGGMVGFHQGMGAGDVGHYRSLSEIKDFHNENKDAYGITEEIAAQSGKTNADAQAMGIERENQTAQGDIASDLQNRVFTLPMTGAEFVTRQHQQDIERAQQQISEKQSIDEVNNQQNTGNANINTQNTQQNTLNPFNTTTQTTGMVTPTATPTVTLPTGQATGTVNPANPTVQAMPTPQATGAVNPANPTVQAMPTAQTTGAVNPANPTAQAMPTIQATGAVNPANPTVQAMPTGQTAGAVNPANPTVQAMPTGQATGVVNPANPAAQAAGTVNPANPTAQAMPTVQAAGTVNPANPTVQAMPTVQATGAVNPANPTVQAIPTVQATGTVNPANPAAQVSPSVQQFTRVNNENGFKPYQNASGSLNVNSSKPQTLNQMTFKLPTANNLTTPTETNNGGDES